MQENQQVETLINKKRQYNNADKRQVYLDSWKKSGLSMSEFCRQQGLPTSTFSTWAKLSKRPKKLFKPVITSVPTVRHENEAGIIEMTFQSAVKIRFLNLPNISLVVRIAKDLAGCS